MAHLCMTQPLVTNGIPVSEQGAAHVVVRRLVLVWKRLVEDTLDPGLIGSATADASVMAPSPFAVKLSVGAVGAVEAVGGGGALSQEVVLLVVVLSPASPSPGGGAVGGGAAACSPTVGEGWGGVPAPTPLTRWRGAPSPQPRVGLSRT